MNDFTCNTINLEIKKINPKEKINKQILDKVKEEYIDKKTYSFDKNLGPIKVFSAFGGFGIYKMNFVIENKKKYQGTQIVELIFKDDTKAKINFQQCEHVNFNLGLSENNLENSLLK